MAQAQDFGPWCASTFHMSHFTDPVCWSAVLRSPSHPQILDAGAPRTEQVSHSKSYTPGPKATQRNRVPRSDATCRGHGTKHTNTDSTPHSAHAHLHRPMIFRLGLGTHATAQATQPAGLAPHCTNPPTSPHSLGLLPVSQTGCTQHESHSAVHTQRALGSRQRPQRVGGGCRPCILTPPCTEPRTRARRTTQSPRCVVHEFCFSSSMPQVQDSPDRSGPHALPRDHSSCFHLHGSAPVRHATRVKLENAVCFSHFP